MADCTETPVFVDCDGVPLVATEDNLGNDVIVFCQDTTPNVTNWDSGLTSEPAGPCIEGFYSDDASSRITHYCHDGQLYPFCTTTGGPSTTRVCYDFSQIVNTSTCYGGNGTGWIVDGVEQIQPACADEEETLGLRVAEIEAVVVNPNFTGVVPPGPSSIAQLLAGGIDTGPTAATATVIAVSGTSSLSPYYGVQQPVVIVDFDFAAGAILNNDVPTGLFFKTGSTIFPASSIPLSGDFGLALWDASSDSFVSIASAGSFGGPAVVSIEQRTGMGDWVRIEGQTIPSGDGDFLVSFAPGQDLQAENLYIVITGLGQGASVDLLTNFQFDHFEPEVPECCECYNQPTGVAGLFNSIDPAGGSWSVIGDSVCADVLDADVSRYGSLTFCSSDSSNIITLEPNATNEPPTITSGSSHTAQENQTSAFTVTAFDDFDTGNLTYLIQGGNDQARFTIDQSTGVVTFLAAPNFEDPADHNTDNTYELIVAVRDTQGLTTQQFVTVIVTDQAETAAPIITSSGTATTPEGATGAIIDVQTADDESLEGAGLTYSLTGPDAALLTIDAATGEISFINPPDFENPADADSDNVYQATVTVTDADNLTDTQSIAITVTDVAENTPPVITSPASATVPEEQISAIDVQTADESREGDGLSYAIVGGADAALFTIDPNNGLVTFITAPDFENPADANGDNDYVFTVTVTDEEGLTDTQTITITVTDEDEGPFFTFAPDHQCIDVQDTICAECNGGTVTFQELINGVWTDI